MTRSRSRLSRAKKLIEDSEAYVHSPATLIYRNHHWQTSDIELRILPKKQSPSGGIEDRLEEIKERRDMFFFFFFAGNRELILPLLPNGRIVCRNTLGEEIRPYQSIKRQPAG